MLTLGHGELVDREPVVVRGNVEVDHARLRPSDRAVRPAVLHRHAVHQHSMHGAVAFDQGRCVGTYELAVGVFERLGWQVRVEPDERLPQASFQDHVAVPGVGALGTRHANRDLGAVEDRVGQAAEPGEGGLFYLRLSKAHRRWYRQRFATSATLPADIDSFCHPASKSISFDCGNCVGDRSRIVIREGSIAA